jgi:signal transduction histidine kinase
MDSADHDGQRASGENNVAGIAKLARSLAHSINGSLSVARGNLMLLKSRLYDPESQILLDEAMTALGKQEMLARGLAAISYWEDYRGREINLQEFFDQRQDRFVHFLGEMGLQIAPCDHFTVWADPEYLELAFNALIINSCEATAGIKTPKMLIKTSALRPGVVAIEACDNGSGVSFQNTWALFNAGFTTKNGGHAGAGLWFVREFARAAGGNAWAETQVGKGSYAGLKIVMTLRTIDKVNGPE